MGDAIEMVKCETNDLLVPAECEIVIEGTVSHKEVEAEGPFGEYPGTFADRGTSQPRQTITAVTYRNDPINPISFPGVPTDNCHVSQGFFQSADVVVALRKGGVPVIDSGAVTWAFATRNHPTLGAYYFPEMEKFGSGLETYHSVAELVHGKGGLVIYSCLPLQERIGHPAKPIMSFEANYPEALKKRVRSNWARWGFETAKST